MLRKLSRIRIMVMWVLEKISSSMKLIVVKLILIWLRFVKNRL